MYIKKIEDLEASYILASSTTMYVTIDADGNDSNIADQVLQFHNQIGLILKNIF